MTEGNDGEEHMSLGEFLEKYYQQFAVMGIFGTVSVFLSDGFPGGSDRLSARAAIFASLSIFALIAAWTCFQALGQLLQKVNNADRPLLTDVGFVVIILSTATLAGAIIDAIFTYSEIMIFAQLVIIPAIGLLIYFRNFPVSRYDVESLKTVFIPYWSFLAMFPMGNGTLEWIYRLFIHISGLNIIALSLATALVLSIHITICESFLGIHRLYSKGISKGSDFRKGSVGQKVKKVKKEGLDWSFPVSVLISSTGITIHLLGFSNISDRYTKPIFFHDIHWAAILTTAVIMFSVGVAATIWNWQDVGEEPKPIRDFLTYASPVILSVSILVVFLAHLEVIGVVQWNP
ncbi:hypothetical protein [Natrinema sp. CGMCC1.2065]|uniref:hypothetical protein n=1 Tax=Natrinema sp. CGMCC1.2065 TaxID=3445767 RepID=UPI003F4A0B5E